MRFQFKSFPISIGTTILILFLGFGVFNSAYSQVKSIILGRPTNTSVTASILFDQSVQYYLQYGTTSGSYPQSTATLSNVLNVPDEVDLTGLSANTKYYYKLQYKLVGATAFTSSPEYSFTTQRAPGSSFTFTVESDEHLYDIKGNRSMYQVCLANQALDNPDFMLSLGDIFGDDHTPLTTTSADMDALHKDYRQYLGQICHSIPFYVCLGNHEGENDYYLNPNGIYTTATNPLPAAPNGIGVWGTLWRKFYYPNPYPNSFYTGNTLSESYGINTPENYYSWTWGDALFVVLDVYRTEIAPGTTPADPAKPTNWDWTLGRAQYDWMRSVLENSTATHKFVFAHHTRGQGRGGIGTATQFEWGGIDGNQNKFNQYRSGWGKPIHQVFVDTGVDVFFQGHDHLFAKEQLNGVVYQEVPMPSDITYTIGYTANASAYPNGNAMDGTGHIRVSVTPSCVTVDYVKAFIPGTTGSAGHNNREVAFSYSIGSCALGNNEIEPENQIKVYPNPTDTKLNIEFNTNSDNHHSKLLNMMGQIILESDSNEINTSAISNGIYILKMDVAPNYSKKIIVQH